MVRKSVWYLLGALLILVTVPLWAEDVAVDREELTSIGDNSIKFINYVGPYDFINTVDQIRSIGRSLGASIDPEKSGRASLGSKYRVIHVVNPEIEEKLDADIFILEPDAAVDHINNLRIIIAGYLETAYKFSPRDAYLVAEFVTYYNAVYRGNMEVAAERYKEPVVKELDGAKMGLDTHYSNWAGKTQMLIPLRGKGSSPQVDTSAISSKEVVEEMRQEDDLGLDSRKDMVELREKEIDKEQAELNKKKKEVRKEEKQLEKKEKSVQKELEKLEEKESSGEKLDKKEQTRQKKLEKEQKELEKEKAAVKEKKESVEKEQKELDKETEDVLEMRDEIAKDVNKVMDKEGEETFTSAETVNPVWFLMVDDEGGGIPFGRVVKYNLDNSRRLAVSEVTAVRGRSMAILPESLLVIAGKESGNSKVRLMLLGKDDLTVEKEGSDDVFPGSLLTVKGSDIFLVCAENGQWRLGRFDTNLVRQAVSEVEVMPWTSIAFDKAALYVQGAGGQVIRLSEKDLKEEITLK